MLRITIAIILFAFSLILACVCLFPLGAGLKEGFDTTILRWLMGSALILMFIIVCSAFTLSKTKAVVIKLLCHIAIYQAGLFFAFVLIAIGYTVKIEYFNSPTNQRPTHIRLG
jgi:hypothetical protein